ncbi:hypothetical protein SEA_SNEK_49 [Arthrobacter phage Snek]|uniref:Uncharacterized protein n=1 Tax=Arthrobacter phage Tweety19 TaxID=2768133 RepID=A0A7G9W246_9CAUD|nr:hypothetical protein PQE19_gp59 [Arthrobacter phage Tweety19]QNO12709.1 hypothetical protein SEA_TWEETY19_50 [Arthrobacter phage Tweety19]
MEIFQRIARKAVARSIDAGLIEATDREAIRAIAGFAASLAAFEAPALFLDTLADGLYDEFNARPALVA